MPQTKLARRLTLRFPADIVDTQTFGEVHARIHAHQTRHRCRPALPLPL